MRAPGYNGEIRDRPAQPGTTMLNVRVTKEEAAAYRAYAKEAGLTLSAWLRKAARGQIAMDQHCAMAKAAG